MPGKLEFDDSSLELCGESPADAGLSEPLEGELEGELGGESEGELEVDDPDGDSDPSRTTTAAKDCGTAGHMAAPTETAISKPQLRSIQASETYPTAD